MNTGEKEFKKLFVDPEGGLQVGTIHVIQKHIRFKSKKLQDPQRWGTVIKYLCERMSKQLGLKLLTQWVDMGLFTEDGENIVKDLVTCVITFEVKEDA